MVYTFKSGSRIKASAQVAGEMCEVLSRTGQLTPKRLLDANRDENAPLHNEFEWDDTVAAEAYRERQAAHIIRCIVVKTDERPESATRAFVRVTESTGEYTPMRIVMGNPDLMENLMKEARRDMEAFVRKYRELNDLNNVIESMNSILDKAV